MLNKVKSRLLSGNKTMITIIILLMTLPLQAQDITNKLGGNTVNETYDVTDSNDNVLLRVQGDGDVGIGTTIPSEVLDIVGNIAVSGTVDGIDIATDVTANTAKISATIYSVGNFAQGGIVFWVDETGQHGLVCAKTDQSTGMRWSAGTDGFTRANGDGPFSGESNTTIIIAAQVAIGDDGATYAARVCNELQITEGGKTYVDWYLPSIEELNLMYQNKATINATAAINGGIAITAHTYWSSTEYNYNNAWLQNFGSSGGKYLTNKSNTYYVRSVRAF